MNQSNEGNATNEEGSTHEQGRQTSGDRVARDRGGVGRLLPKEDIGADAANVPGSILGRRGSYGIDEGRVLDTIHRSFGNDASTRRPTKSTLLSVLFASSS